MTFSQFMIAFIYNIFNKKSRFFIFLTMWTYLHTTGLRREHSQFSNQHVWKYALNFGESLLIIEIPDSSFQKGDNYEILKTRWDILKIPTKKVNGVFCEINCNEVCVKQFQFLHTYTIWGMWSDQRIFIIIFLWGAGGSMPSKSIRSVWFMQWF